MPFRRKGRPRMSVIRNLGIRARLAVVGFLFLQPLLYAVCTFYALKMESVAMQMLARRRGAETHVRVA